MNMLKPIHGVNLGGWFVLEQWMKPSLFEGLSGPDETIFSKEKTNAKSIRMDHIQRFIQKDDLVFLLHHGFHQVRLPVPWWIEGEAPYIRLLESLDDVMRWCDELGIEVLLDLHTAPGCQNGFDNGGITNQIEWHRHESNIQLTIDKLVMYTKRYASYRCFIGIELLNEPHVTVPLSTLMHFYALAYRAIRQITPKLIVMHDGFRPEDPAWKLWFQQQQLTNVAFDIHLYLCFNEAYRQLTIEQLLEVPLIQWKKLIRDIQTYIPVIIGEWSLGFNEDRLQGKSPIMIEHIYRLLASSQMLAFEEAFGWYFWSYRIERDSHVGWDFRRLIEKSIFPNVKQPNLFPAR
jgi:glucan 1,3-beta-glucosidase